MEFNTTVDLIIKDLNEACEIIDDLRNYPGVPALQVELAKSKCKSASEVIAFLKDIRNTKLPEALKETPIYPDASNTAPGIQESHAKKVSESAIFADTFGNIPDSLNEKLSSLRDDDEVSDILKTKKLTNLSEAIGLNDKFLFIRELFKGNPESYNKAISSLDEVKSLADAKAIITSFTGENNETYAVRQLLDLVKRKFS